MFALYPSYVPSEEKIQLIQVKVTSILDRVKRGKNIADSKSELQKLAKEIGNAIQGCVDNQNSEKTLQSLFGLKDQVDNLAERNIFPIIKSQEFSPLLVLPSELIIHIFSFLKPEELIEVRGFSQIMHTFGKDPALWQALCRKEKIISNNLNVNWEELYKEHHSYFSENEINALIGSKTCELKCTNGLRVQFGYKPDATILDLKKFACYHLGLKRNQINLLNIIIEGIKVEENQRQIADYSLNLARVSHVIYIVLHLSQYQQM